MGADAPDVVAALDEPDRERRVERDTETCLLDGQRRFVRGLIELRLERSNLPDSAGIGAWVEMAPTTFRDYQGAPTDGSTSSRFEGRLATDFKGFGDVTELPVYIVPQGGNARPLIEPLDQAHPLAEQQRQGVTMAQWVELLHRNMPDWYASELRARSKRYRFELEEPRRSTCNCCGAEIVALTRFVYFDEDAYAVYYAKVYLGHEPRAIQAYVSIGHWGEEANPADRDAFALEIRQEGVRVGDAATSPWPNVEIMGRGLSREEALSHARIGDVFEITDVMPDHDPVLNELRSG
jgi:hypothetical protein